ncbi:hypothetical protein P8935_18560 [Telmatobacter sp. DSM 110680]|uniref:Restriction endonuclease n=1 Tax=Telmatobacter sp. DSM 110680 TaxID=3036704 RepID=A0AAU7DFI3_9BACT
MPTFSRVFGLGKSQLELDFVDVSLQRDNSLFIDPFGIAQALDRWSLDAATTVGTFFQQVIDDIRAGHEDNARQLLLNLREPNETRLGYSANRPKGAGIGEQQAEEIFEALRTSSAVRHGFITALEECELMIPGISHDKISDLTTNILRGQLVEYTRAQCGLHNVPMQNVPIDPVFDTDTMRWQEGYAELPVWRNRPILLVPKSAVRYSPAYHAERYYQHYVLNFLKERELANPASNLVRLIRNEHKKTERRVVTKKDLAARYPGAKNFLFEFSRQNPHVLRDYREDLKRMEATDTGSDVDSDDETVIADALAAVLRQTPTGDDHATAYHRLMIGIVELLFFPKLTHPKKEREIHEGRKRIDIVMENAARTGLFFTIPNIRRLPCAYVPLECKNYGREVGNPELDQLAGRFSVNRGKLGFLCCRHFENRDLFIRRCRDTFRDDRGLVLPLDDDTLLGYLNAIARGARNGLEREWSDLVNEVWLN